MDPSDEASFEERLAIVEDDETTLIDLRKGQEDEDEVINNLGQLLGEPDPDSDGEEDKVDDEVDDVADSLSKAFTF